MNGIVLERDGKLAYDRPTCVIGVTNAAVRQNMWIVFKLINLYFKF